MMTKAVVRKWSQKCRVFVGPLESTVALGSMPGERIYLAITHGSGEVLAILRTNGDDIVLGSVTSDCDGAPTFWLDGVWEEVSQDVASYGVSSLGELACLVENCW